jgi:hypothetical protein
VVRGFRRRTAAAGLVLAAAAIAGGFVIARGPADSDYFGPNEPTWVRVPTTLGDPVYVGVLVLRAQPGDSVELDEMLVEGIQGDATVEPIVRVLRTETRILGGIAESDLGDTIDLASYSPLTALRFAEADGPVELAVRIVGTTPVHGFNGLRLRVRIDGVPIEDWIPMRASICTGSTRPEAVERCRPIEAQMLSQEP